MKKILTILLIMPLFWACSSDSEDIPQPSNKEYIISLGFTGEITNIAESPLTRTKTNDLYGIQVYATPKDGGKEAPYAYGLFDNIENVVIKLLSGYEYRFISTLVIGGVSLIDIYDGGYFTPFSTTSEGSNYTTTSITNEFKYDKDIHFLSLDRGYSRIRELKATFHKPNIDRYYGELSNFTPGKNNKAVVNMKRTGFGLKIIARNLSEGELIITMANAPSVSIKHPETTVENIYTFDYVSDAYHREHYTEATPILISWKRNDEVVIPIANQEILFKRNKLTTVTVNVADITIDSGVSINKELGNYDGEEKITI